MPFTYTFTVQAAPAPPVVGACWDATSTSSPLSLIDTKLAKALPTPALDTLRRYFLQATTTDRDVAKSVRVTIQLANETTLRVLLGDVTIPDNVFTSKMCTKRKHIDIDTDMTARSGLYLLALNEAVSRNVLSASYAKTLQFSLQGKSPTERNCAVAVLLVLSAWFLN